MQSNKRRAMNEIMGLIEHRNEGRGMTDKAERMNVQNAELRMQSYECSGIKEKKKK